MAKKGRPKKKKYVRTQITANAPRHEVREYFINSLIEMNEYLKEREMTGQIRDTQKEKIRIDRVKARSQVCNIALRGLKDMQLDDYEKKLESLMQGLKLNPDNDDIIELPPEKVTEIEDLEYEFNKLKDGGLSDNGN